MKIQRFADSKRYCYKFLHAFCIVWFFNDFIISDHKFYLRITETKLNKREFSDRNLSILNFKL